MKRAEIAIGPRQLRWDAALPEARPAFPEERRPPPSSLHPEWARLARLLQEGASFHWCLGCRRPYLLGPGASGADEYFCRACLDPPLRDEAAELYTEFGGGD